jgi:hypothetical protein
MTSYLSQDLGALDVKLEETRKQLKSAKKQLAQQEKQDAQSTSSPSNKKGKKKGGTVTSPKKRDVQKIARQVQKLYQEEKELINEKELECVTKEKIRHDAKQIAHAFGQTIADHGLKLKKWQPQNLESNKPLVLSNTVQELRESIFFARKN